MAPPSTTAPCQLSSHGRLVYENTHSSRKWPATAPAIVSITCDMPRPNTMRRMLRSFGRLNSRPMTNMRNTTPNSPSTSTACESPARASACGPMATPATR
jgi:hypothetical protein